MSTIPTKRTVEGKNNDHEAGKKIEAKNLEDGRGLREYIAVEVYVDHLCQ